MKHIFIFSLLFTLSFLGMGGVFAATPDFRVGEKVVVAVDSGRCEVSAIRRGRDGELGVEFTNWDRTRTFAGLKSGFPKVGATRAGTCLLETCVGDSLRLDARGSAILRMTEVDVVGFPDDETACVKPRNGREIVRLSYGPTSSGMPHILSMQLTSRKDYRSPRIYRRKIIIDSSDCQSAERQAQAAAKSACEAANPGGRCIPAGSYVSNTWRPGLGINPFKMSVEWVQGYCNLTSTYVYDPERRQ